jgi:hypothetical protein
MVIVNYSGLKLIFATKTQSLKGSQIKLSVALCLSVFVAKHFLTH